MKTKKILTIFILFFCYLANIAQTTMVLDKKMEEEMRELIRDSVIYDCFIKGVFLDRDFKNGLIKEKEYTFQKNELQRLKSERKKEKSSERTVITGSGLAAGAETTLAVNPNNPNEIVAGFMINGVSGGCAVYFSADGGSTWNPSAFIPQNMIMATIPGVISVDGGGDPTITVDNNGVFYFAWIGVYTMPSGNYYSTLYATSSNGGASFTAPPLSDFTITAYNQNLGFGFFDRIWIAADASSGSASGTIYLNGDFYGSGDMGQLVYIKPAASATFSLSANQPIPAPPGFISTLSNIEAGDNGVIHASALRYDGSSVNPFGEVLYSRSADQGMTWSTPIFIANAPYSGTSYFFYEENAAPSLGVDSNTVYIAWTNLYPTPKVFYAVSTDDGLTWSAPINIGSLICPGPYYHTFINLSPSNGNCSMAWYRMDSVTLQTEYVMAEVMNDGATAVNYEVISPGNISLSGDFFGHYNVSRRNGCITHSIWVDGALGAATAYAAKIDACALGTEVTPVNSDIIFHSIYPVPAADQLQLYFSINEDAVYTISIFDINGKQVLETLKNKFTKGKNNFTANISQLSSGTYLLRLEKDNGVYLTRKFVKQ